MLPETVIEMIVEVRFPDTMTGMVDEGMLPETVIEMIVEVRFPDKGMLPEMVI